MYVLSVFYGHGLFIVSPGRLHEWQAPAQCLQSPQQEDLPFCLSLTNFIMMPAMIPARMRHTRMVPQFIAKNASMFRSSFPRQFFQDNFFESFFVNVVASLYFLKKSI